MEVDLHLGFRYERVVRRDHLPLSFVFGVDAGETNLSRDYFAALAGSLSC